eukprot:CAMPEP_0118797750 /NCGR_PEP_ID=MMETSP1161-20130426/242_1 /TAXON_ID=249345 /ORGANISM="Picochlorum oklahomensis, Strain CCMP2329" /LENGTH=120 /DNA_ID=CAMNT_0006724965 /DNA_START=66 /DNA_END=428 /DNA_ORIENTATION=+
MKYAGFMLMAMLMAVVLAAGEVIIGDTSITGDSACPLFKDGYCFVCPSKDCDANITGDDFKCSCGCDGVTKDCVKKVAPAPLAESIQEKMESSKAELEKSKAELEKSKAELEKSKAELGL